MLGSQGDHRAATYLILARPPTAIQRNIKANNTTARTISPQLVILEIGTGVAVDVGVAVGSGWGALATALIASKELRFS